MIDTIVKMPKSERKVQLIQQYCENQGMLYKLCPKCNNETIFFNGDELVCGFCDDVTLPYEPPSEYPQVSECPECRTYSVYADEIMVEPGIYEFEGICLSCQKEIPPDTCINGHKGYNLGEDEDGLCYYCHNELEHLMSKD